MPIAHIGPAAADPYYYVPQTALNRTTPQGVEAANAQQTASRISGIDNPNTYDNRAFTRFESLGMTERPTPAEVGSLVGQRASLVGGVQEDGVDPRGTPTLQGSPATSQNYDLQGASRMYMVAQENPSEPQTFEIYPPAFSAALPTGNGDNPVNRIQEQAYNLYTPEDYPDQGTRQSIATPDYVTDPTSSQYVYQPFSDYGPVLTQGLEREAFFDNPRQAAFAALSLFGPERDGSAAANLAAPVSEQTARSVGLDISPGSLPSDSSYEGESLVQSLVAPPPDLATATPEQQESRSESYLGFERNFQSNIEGLNRFTPATEYPAETANELQDSTSVLSSQEPNFYGIEFGAPASEPVTRSVTDSLSVSTQASESPTLESIDAFNAMTDESRDAYESQLPPDYFTQPYFDTERFQDIRGVGFALSEDFVLNRLTDSEYNASYVRDGSPYAYEAMPTNLGLDTLTPFSQNDFRFYV